MITEAIMMHFPLKTQLRLIHFAYGCFCVSLTQSKLPSEDSLLYPVGSQVLIRKDVCLRRQLRGLRLYCNRKRGINKRDFYDHFSTVILCLEKLNFGTET